MFENGKVPLYSYYCRLISAIEANDSSDLVGMVLNRLNDRFNAVGDVLRDSYEKSLSSLEYVLEPLKTFPVRLLPIRMEGIPDNHNKIVNITPPSIAYLAEMSNNKRSELFEYNYIATDQPPLLENLDILKMKSFDDRFVLIEGQSKYPIVISFLDLSLRDLNFDPMLWTRVLSGLLTDSLNSQTVNALVTNLQQNNEELSFILLRVLENIREGGGLNRMEQNLPNELWELVRNTKSNNVYAQIVQRQLLERDQQQTQQQRLVNQGKLPSFNKCTEMSGEIIYDVLSKYPNLTSGLSVLELGTCPVQTKLLLRLFRVYKNHQISITADNKIAMKSISRRHNVNAQDLASIWNLGETVSVSEGGYNSFHNYIESLKPQTLFDYDTVVHAYETTPSFYCQLVAAEIIIQYQTDGSTRVSMMNENRSRYDLLSKVTGASRNKLSAGKCSKEEAFNVIFVLLPHLREFLCVNETKLVDLIKRNLNDPDVIEDYFFENANIHPYTIMYYLSKRLDAIRKDEKMMAIVLNLLLQSTSSYRAQEFLRYSIPANITTSSVVNQKFAPEALNQNLEFVSLTDERIEWLISNVDLCDIYNPLLEYLERRNNNKLYNLLLEYNCPRLYLE